MSHQTVSRVLNGMPNVRPATRERVEHAIAQLRYSPSPAARSLVSRRTRTIGLIAPAVTDHGPARIGMHFSMAARAARYSVDTVTTVDDDDQGPVRMQNVMWRMTDSPGNIRHTGRAHSADTDGVLAEFGLSPGDIATLRAAGVI